MISNLPKELLWADKTDISEFMSDELGSRIVSIISFAKSSITTALDADTMLKLYNEAFYLSTRVVYEHDAEARPESYIEKIMDDIGDKELLEHVILIMFMVITQQSNKSNEVLQFIDKLQKQYLPQTPFRLINWVNKVIKPKKGNRDISLKPCPCPADELRDIDWNKITQGFSKHVIIDILDLWDSDNEKGKVIRQIEQAYTTCQPVLNDDKSSDKADGPFFTQQKNLYTLTDADKNARATKGGRPKGKPLEELFTETCSPAQRERFIKVVSALKGKDAVFVLKVATLPDVDVINKVPSYLKALECFPNIGASSNYYKYKGIPMDEKEIDYFKRQLIPQK